MPRNLLLAFIIAVLALGGASCTVEKTDEDKGDKTTDDDGSSDETEDEDDGSSDETEDDDGPVTGKPDAGKPKPDAGKDGGTLIDAGRPDAGRGDGGSSADGGSTNCFN